MTETPPKVWPFPTWKGQPYTIKERKVQTKHIPVWDYDPQTGEHFLPINDVESWKVYKTAAGDYALTLHNDDDGHGGDVEYFNTLTSAKRTASNRSTPKPEPVWKTTPPAPF